VLWPTHCVQGTHGAAFHAGLNADAAQLVLRKGFHPDIDSYSAFYENDRTTPTGLDGYLRSRGVISVTLVGLATDFCVAWSAVDAARHGYDVTVLEGATRAIDLNGSLAGARRLMRDAGVKVEH
jgi:nicotinamidase/pyrazinamidase